MSRLILKLNAPNQIDQAKCVSFLSQRMQQLIQMKIESELKQYENNFEYSIDKDDIEIIDI